MTDMEMDLQIAEVALQEADEAFAKLRQDYHELREHADILEALLRNHGIEYPDFCGW
ncbi:hypothetical protein [Petrocella sp. FN5]|uniref:hypothetical protein n=1 Tax=Petrocella sp. FN5 TaxID=3032002 RepID=UPI0023DC89CB|nr:hypothetical protein [Petrocella sp. FN5]MDF1616114.1 hypothetical protein [Petrocella sp. FN5]